MHAFSFRMHRNRVDVVENTFSRVSRQEILSRADIDFISEKKTDSKPAFDYVSNYARGIQSASVKKYQWLFHD